MSHNLESMVYCGETPWHGLGVQVPSELPWDEAIRQGGLDWNVVLQDTWVENPSKPQEPIKTPFLAVTRASDGAVYSMVSKRYTPIQNAQAFQVFGELFGRDARLETAGSLRGGALVWGLARFQGGDFVVAGGDRHQTFLLVTTAHDGSGTMRALPTMVRVVCNNTLNMALGTRASEGIAVRHSGDVEAKIAEGSRVLEATLGLIQRTRESLETLVTIQVSTPQVRELIEEWIPGDATRSKNTRGKILYLADHGRGNHRYQGTAYSLFQGVTDYIDHERNGHRTRENGFSSAMFGSGAQLKNRAMTDLLALAA